MHGSKSNNSSSSNSMHGSSGNMRYASRASIRASCYTIDAVTASLSGFHYSTTSAGGRSFIFLISGSSGIPEVSSGSPSPPSSPSFVATTGTNSARASSSNRSRQGDAAYTITEECERLFCETLRAVFHGERKTASLQDSLVADTFDQQQQQQLIAARDSKSGSYSRNGVESMPLYPSSVGSSISTMSDASDMSMSALYMSHNSLSSPPSSLDTLSFFPNHAGHLAQSMPEPLISQYLEVWDYTGAGIHFHGFVTNESCGQDACDSERTLFIFFDSTILENKAELRKPSLMALIELASSTYAQFDCTKMAICLDRGIEAAQAQKLVRDLGWVGFEMTTLAPWAEGIDLTSEQWLVLAMDV